MVSGFSHKPANVSLKGATRKEKTRSSALPCPTIICMQLGTCMCREELLEEVRAERAARGLDKKRAVAAVTIQRVFRGHAARWAMRAAVSASFLSEFGPMVTDPKQHLSAVQVPERLLRPALFLLEGRRRWPPPADPSSTSSGIDGTADGGPLSLSHPCCAAGVTSSAAGEGKQQQQQRPLLQVTRCLLAVVMRSIASGDEDTCCLALGLPSTMLMPRSDQVMSLPLIDVLLRVVKGPSLLTNHS